MTDHSGGKRWALAYGILGIVVFLLGLFHLGVELGSSPLVHQLVSGALTILISGGILTGALWHYRNPLPRERNRRITAWIAGGVVVVAGIGVASLFVGSEALKQSELRESLHLMGSLGLALGFAFGSLEARVIEATELAARAEILEAERERLAILNDLLRHYVLNAISVIDGHAAILERQTAGEKRDSARTIAQESDRITAVVERISLLTKTRWTREEETSADVAGVLAEAVQSRCPESTSVDLVDTGQELVGNVGFEDGLVLLAEGIRAATEREGSVSIEGADGKIRVTAAPVTVPGSLREELMQPVATSVGLEIYLAKKVLEPAIGVDVLESDDRELIVTLTGRPVRSDGTGS
ncbi:MAG: hypothetical protein ABEJ84_03930 [Halodesulfurarchaeum sp.]